ncbi:sugar transferase [Nocardioides daeguensis]|uniref:sugar transferase n=1 Tax=Nocardioides daeguensis TaxID=908359 RepID=UPI001C48523F|nr:sugar transferase [Nocardioides daeguensis]MBV6726162.1 sugar transferase [Nocardioides daeguensis]MCR1772005.1 sugar transferase [Nocardioides daeguensis]
MPYRPRHPLAGYTLGVLALDVAIMGAVGALAVFGRETLSVFERSLGVSGQLGVVGPASIVAWLLVTALMGGYRSELLGAGAEEFKRVLQATMITAGLLGVGCYLAKYQLSRGFFVLAFTIGPIALLLGRWAARQALHALRRRGRLQVHVLVAGSPQGIDAMARTLGRETWLGYSVIGGVVPEEQDLRDETDGGVPVLGRVGALTSLAEQQGAHLVIFADGSIADAAEMKEAIWALERHRVKVALAPRLDNISLERITIRPVSGVPLIQVDSPTWSDAGALGKRTFDILGAAFLLAVLAPLFALVSAVIWLHDRGPVTFRHRRIGRNGEPFDCLKFRTMCVDAESLVQELQDQASESALLFKMTDDPRITRPGRWLRRYSFDELPQLVNVLRGDMSLVGPRPQVDREVALYEGAMSRRLLVRPGMTGLWQVSGRNDLDVAEAMRLDLYYVDNWSMLQDLAILGRTVRAVASSDGAY